MTLTLEVDDVNNWTPGIACACCCNSLIMASTFQYIKDTNTYICECFYPYRLEVTAVEKGVRNRPLAQTGGKNV
jgi:hypothetical protein